MVRTYVSSQWDNIWHQELIVWAIFLNYTLITAQPITEQKTMTEIVNKNIKQDGKKC